MRPAPSVSWLTSTSTLTTSPAAPPPPAAASPWHSPLPYLFGGLAAMLGLITLALLILACSYWKLNNYLGTGDATTSSSSSGRPGAADGDGSKSPAASTATFAGLVAVVMAGEKTPTFLAAPVVLVRRAHGDSAATTATGDEGSPETEQESGGKAGEGESGVVAVAGGERERQVDQV